MRELSPSAALRLDQICTTFEKAWLDGRDSEMDRAGCANTQPFRFLKFGREDFFLTDVY